MTLEAVCAVAESMCPVCTRRLGWGGGGGDCRKHVSCLHQKMGRGGGGSSHKTKIVKSCRTECLIFKSACSEQAPGNCMDEGRGEGGRLRRLHHLAQMLRPRSGKNTRAQKPWNNDGGYCLCNERDFK